MDRLKEKRPGLKGKEGRRIREGKIEVEDREGRSKDRSWRSIWNANEEIRERKKDLGWENLGWKGGEREESSRTACRQSKTSDCNARQ